MGAAEARVAAGAPGSEEELAAAEWRLEDVLAAALDDFDDLEGTLVIHT